MRRFFDRIDRNDKTIICKIFRATGFQKDDFEKLITLVWDKLVEILVLHGSVALKLTRGAHAPGKPYAYNKLQRPKR